MIEFVKRAFPESLIENPMGFGAARQQHHAAGFFIQAVHDPKLPDERGEGLGEVWEFRMITIWYG